MPNPPLQDGLVDAFLSNLDQLPADHNGPVGRIKTLTNAQTKHYTHASQFNPAKISVEPRQGFTSLPQTVRDLAGTTLPGAEWNESSLLDTMSDQLVAVDDRTPRVFNGYDAWTEYGDVKLLTNKLREESLVGGYGVSTTPTQCTLGHVQAVAFTQHPVADTWEIWLGFREAPGTQTDTQRRASPLAGPWTVPPVKIESESVPSCATVMTDGTRFFLIWNTDLATPTFNVWAFDVNGKFLAATSFLQLDTTRAPGYWDVTVDNFDTTKLIHVQPAGDTDDPTVDVHVRFTRIVWTGSISLTGSTDATIVCNGWCNWLENESDGNSYLVTMGGPGETNRRLRAYRVFGLARTHEWDIDNVTPQIDAITGYVPNQDTSIVVAVNDTASNSGGFTSIQLHNASFSGGDVGSRIIVLWAAPNVTYGGDMLITAVTNSTTVVTDKVWPGGSFTSPASGTATLRAESDLYVVVGELEPQATTGPQYDPQMRRIVTYHVNDGGSAIVRQSASQALVSKSTKIGDDWFDITFYQSGSGLSSGDTSIVPDVTDGDWFSGSQKQTVTVRANDGFSGPNQAFVVPTASSYPFPINTTQGQAPANIDDTGTPDQVAYMLAPAGLPFLAEGTPCLQWTFKNCNPGTNIYGGQLKIVGSSVALANHTWDIYGPNGSNKFLTPTINTVGGDLGSLSAPILFVGSGGGGGTVEAVSMTQYNIPDLGAKYDAANVDLLTGGVVTISGNTTGANNGNKTIVRAFIGDPGAPLYQRIPTLWVTTGSESSSGNGFTAVVKPASPNVWTFNGGQLFASPLIGSFLVVENDTQFPENNSGGVGYEITDDLLHAIVTNAGDTGTTRSQIFEAPFPDIHIELQGVEFTFFIQGLATELAVNAFRFRGALLQVSSANASVAGLYKIIDVNPSLDGTIYTERVVQSSDVPAYDFRIDSADGFVIFFPIASQAPFQPTYFMTPILGRRPTIGMFDRLNAYNNWRLSGVNTLDGHLTRVSGVNGTLHFVAPTTQERITEANGNQQLVQSAIVGIKGWTISPEFGTPVNSLIPGCQAVDYEGDSFPEDGFALAPEAPWLISQDTAAATQLGLRQGGTYVYTIVIESQDRAGKRVPSPPSPPLIVGPLSGTNNQITLAGDLPVPWDVHAGTLYADTYGITNRLPITISVYRTSYRNGIETTTQYKITSDLQPNAEAPVSTDNASGFSFADGQWTYVDQNPDLVIQVNEPLYSGVALPRFGAPAFTDGEFWNDRYWIIDSAGAIWFSTAVTDGQRPSWFPGFTIAPPPGDRPVTVRGLQQFLIVTCEKSVYYLPATALPGVLLTEAGQVPIPSLIPLPFPNGCTGQAITTPAGVMYASTALGIWNVTRSLTNDPVSLNAVDIFEGMAGKIRGLTIDRDQRLAISTDNTLIVYDFVSGLWSEWFLPVQAIRQSTTYNGRFCVRAGEFVLLQTDDAFDVVDSVLSPIDWTVQMAGLSFSSVRAFVRLRRMQIVGKYRGPHNMQVTFAYPDDFPDDPTACPVLTPSASTPYLIEAIPGHGRASQFDVTIAVNHDGQEVPGDSCSVEVLSCKIGVAPGQRQVTPGQRV